MGATDQFEQTRAAAMAGLTDLETSLVAHGFSVEVERKFWALTVTNRADRTAPKRSKRLQLAADDNGRLDWFWVRDGSPDVEPLCPIKAIDHAVEAIAHALRPAAHQ